MFARLASALAVGFVGAYPFASASGLAGMLRDPDDLNSRIIIVFGGIILFLLTLALIGPTLRLVHRVLEILARVEERPRPVVALVMMILGVCCSVAAMATQFNATARPPSGLSMNLGGTGMNLNGMTRVDRVPGSFALGVLTILTFLLGLSLISLGIWASLKPAVPTGARIVKPAVPEFDEAAT